MESFSKLDYPKQLIDVLWIENNSSDNTWTSLQGYYNQFKDNYRSFKLLQISAGIKLPKELYGEHGNTGGKVSTKTSKVVKKVRSEHFISILNYALSLADDSDFVFFLFADCIVSPDIINKFVIDLENHPDCGWIGGVMHKRYPNHFRKKDMFPMERGLASPIMRIFDNESPPEGQKEEWVLRNNKLTRNFVRTYKQQKEFFGKYCPEKFPYEYGIYIPTEEEILLKQKVGDGVFEVSYCGHVWMMRPELYRLGLRFRIAPLETGIAFGDDMMKKGMKICCDSNVYIQHISVDGRIYRKDLCSLPRFHQIIPDLCFDNVANFFEEVGELHQREEYESLLQRCWKINKHIPHKPAKGEQIRDPLTGEELDSEKWDARFGKYKKFMERV
jgi:hypothetical protein